MVVAALLAVGWAIRGISDHYNAQRQIASFLSVEVGKTADGRVVRIGDVLLTLVQERIAADAVKATK